MRLRIGIDLDSTLNNLIEALLDEYNKKYCKQIKYSDITEYHFQKRLMPECNNPFEEFCNYSFMISLDIAPGAVDVLTELSESHDIYFVTAGHPNTMGARHAWLQKHFEFYRPEMLIGCVDKKLLKLHVLVDDYVCQFGEGADYYAILFDQPWNSRDNSTIRINSFPELLDQIDIIDGMFEDAL